MQEYKVTVYNNRTQWRDLKTLKLHRLDGPAVEWAGGSKEWWVEGKRHRLDGPAYEYANGSKAWYVEDKEYSEQAFNEYIEKLNKPADPCSNKVVEIEGRKYRLTAID